MSKKEQTTPYSPMVDEATELEWNGKLTKSPPSPSIHPKKKCRDCGVPYSTNDSDTQDDMSSSNPFVYEGARPDMSVHGISRKNVILFGETGVGKSSVINLMACVEVAQTSSNLEGCTLEAREYSFALPGETSLSIYDTVGLNEPEMGVNTFFGAIEKAHQLVRSLHDAGGIDLLVFCIRGGRITTTMQRNYRLFFEFLCGKKVPLAFIVTHLEDENVMESWWERNEKTLVAKYGIQSVAHACVTATPTRVTTHAARRAESRTALQTMLHHSLNNLNPPYVKDVRGWFASFAETLWSFLMKGMPLSLRRRDLLRRLQKRCALSPEAQELADMLARSG